MGWAGGSRVARDMIESLKFHVSDTKVRKRVYHDLIGALEGNDWDTHDEALGIDEVFDEAMKDKYPKWFEDLDE